MLVKMMHNTAVNSMFKQLACDQGERNWSAVLRLFSVFLLENRSHQCLFPILRDLSLVRGKLEK